MLLGVLDFPKTISYAKFGGQTECIMGNWKIVNTTYMQSQTKIVGPLPPNTVSSLLAHLLVLPMLFITVNSPNLAHQHWEAKKTAKCPNNFD